MSADMHKDMWGIPPKYEIRLQSLTNECKLKQWNTIFYLSHRPINKQSLKTCCAGKGVKKCLFLDVPGGSVVKNPLANAGDTGSIPGPGRAHLPWSN